MCEYGYPPPAGYDAVIISEEQQQYVLPGYSCILVYARGELVAVPVSVLWDMLAHPMVTPEQEMQSDG